MAHGRDHHFFGIELHRGIRASSVPGSLASQQQPAPGDNGTLLYHHGPVVHSSAPYLIFWAPSGESIPSSSQALMKRYFTDVAADTKQTDDVYGVTRQYTDGTGFAGGDQTFDPNAQVLLDTHAYPARDTANCPGTTYPTCLTDPQLQQELARVIAANNLPTDGAAGAAQFPRNAPIYFIVLPGDVNVCGSAVGCASTTFCAYHSSMTDGSNTLLYAAMPMLLAASQPKSCQSDGNSAVQKPNGDLADVVVGDLSHEDNETLTDPTAQGWYDNTSGNEEADGCSATGSFSPANETDPNAFLPTLGGSGSAGTLYDQLINGNQYYTQSEWSNGDSTCKMEPTAATLTPSFTVSGTREAGSSLSFNPSASTHTNAISSETFDFGDGSTPAFNAGGLASVSHTYAAGGTYTVTLTLVDNRGNLQSTTQQVTIAAGPTPSFSYSPFTPLEGTSVSFDGSSSTADPGAHITSYSWNFGDGTPTASGATPSHTYAKYGTYTVTLTVTDSDGLSNKTSQQITVSDESPTAGFTIGAGPYAAGAPVSFTGSGSDPDGAISSYSWDFGDGTPAGLGATPSHVYATGGTYTVTLTVTDSDGQTSKASQPITVYSRPSAVFDASPSSPMEGMAVSFDGTGSSDPDPGVTISSYTWNFGDGTPTGSGPTPSHTYAKYGTYTVTLTVTNSVGVTGTATRQVTVADEAPTAALTIAPNPATAGHPVSFAGSGSDPDGMISSYSWNFGDGTTGTGPAPNHTYGTAGAYTVTLTVTDSDGQSGRVTGQLEVLAASPTGGVTPVVPPAAPPAQAGFVVSTRHPAARVPVRFSGASSHGSITSYRWSFGDGAHGSGVAPAHTYRTAGIYRVSLTVVASSGSSASTSGSVIVVTGGRIKKISIVGKRGSAVLAIALTGPGRLSVGWRRFGIARAETIKVRVTPTSAERRRLQTTNRLTLAIWVSFAPRVGQPARSLVSIRISR